MANLKDIRSRISSVENNQKVTRAMKMVSAAKLRRSQQAIVSLRPYARGLLNVIADIAETERVEHPLLRQVAQPRRVLLVVMASDRGLCGGFNANINRFAEKYYQDSAGQYEKLDFLFIGRKTADYFKRRHIDGVDNITNLARDISYKLAGEVAARLMKDFVEGEYDEIRMIYNEFKSAISQHVTIEKLLPVDLNKSSFTGGVRVSRDMIFEPEVQAIIDELLNKHFTTQVYRCMSESVAAEHGARMNAMENATKNATEIIQTLTLTYNKMRQASITTELIEITSGAEALNA